MLFAPLLQVEAPADVDVPDSLLPEPELQQLMAERNPHFVPVLGMPEGSSPYTRPDPVTGTALTASRKQWYSKQ